MPSETRTAVVLKETDKYIEYNFPIGHAFNSGAYQRREQKFMCRGGPLDGEFKTNTQLEEANLTYKAYNCQAWSKRPGYERYNCASSRRDQLRCVYVWISE
jgi:hypothetical protein